MTTCMQQGDDEFNPALIQFSDTETASSAKNALDGRGIPSYLLPDHLEPCTLKITYSAHTDLSVKFQSHRSRDYTNPYLPVAPSAIDATGQLGVGLDGRKLEPESNVLLASIENMQYAVTLDVLQTVFPAFGFVQKIAMFDKNGGLQALIQYLGDYLWHTSGVLPGSFYACFRMVKSSVLLHAWLPVSLLTACLPRGSWLSWIFWLILHAVLELRWDRETSEICKIDALEVELWTIFYYYGHIFYPLSADMNKDDSPLQIDH